MDRCQFGLQDKIVGRSQRMAWSLLLRLTIEIRLIRVADLDGIRRQHFSRCDTRIKCPVVMQISETQPQSFQHAC